MGFWAVYGYFAIFCGPLTGFYGYSTGSSKGFYGVFSQLRDIQWLLLQAKQLHDNSLLMHDLIDLVTTNNAEEMSSRIKKVSAVSRLY